MQGCSVNKIPTSIGQLKKLETLNLYNNNLSDIPPEIEGLENLKTIMMGSMESNIFNSSAN